MDCAPGRDIFIYKERRILYFAEVSDAPLIQDLIIKTFMEYKDEIPSSSALEETVH